MTATAEPSLVQTLGIHGIRDQVSNPRRLPRLPHLIASFHIFKVRSGAPASDVACVHLHLIADTLPDQVQKWRSGELGCAANRRPLSPVR